MRQVAIIQRGRLQLKQILRTLETCIRRSCNHTERSTSTETAIAPRGGALDSSCNHTERSTSTETHRLAKVRRARRGCNHTERSTSTETKCRQFLLTWKSLVAIIQRGRLQLKHRPFVCRAKTEHVAIIQRGRLQLKQEEPWAGFRDCLVAIIQRGRLQLKPTKRIVNTKTLVSCNHTERSTSTETPRLSARLVSRDWLQSYREVDFN